MLTNRKPRRRHLIMTASLVIALVNLQAMAAGEIDLSFTGTVQKTHNSNPTELRVTSSVVLPDGKVLVGGGFTSVGSHPRRGVVPLNSDRTVDRIEATVTPPGVQPDGQIIAAGEFGFANPCLPIRQPRIHLYTDD